MYGRGLNSIPVRFALLTGVLSLLCAGAEYLVLSSVEPAVGLGWSRSLLLAGMLLLPALVTWLAASKLKAQIDSLRYSTEAIVAGDINSPVEVDCACEVGGLAESFRAMVARLNSNIVRMNVLAYVDATTGLPNRAVLSHALQQALADNGGKAFEAGILFMDIDGFKGVNDTFGHEAGDELLRLASDRILIEGIGAGPDQIDTCTTSFGELASRPPQGIVFARFAGDEFVAILPNVTDRAELERHASRICAALAKPFILGGTEVSVGASIGIATTPLDSADAAELVSCADLAMYAAKHAGKGKYSFFDRSLRDAVAQRARVESDLRRAIAAQEFVLHYQPKFRNRGTELVGVEALVRWRHPEGGLVYPDRFIDVAEKAGLMPALGACVIEQAARQTRRWMDQGLRMPIAINISPLQFDDRDLVPDVLEALRRNAVDPSLIELEITESSAMSDPDRSCSQMTALRAAGLRISIDDFGTGFSNLSRLSKLPFNEVKIDRSIIADIADGGRTESMVRAIVGLAHALGHTTVAEGVETLEQLHVLDRVGCDTIQGFLFGRPMDIDQFERWRDARARSPAIELQRLVSVG